MKITNLVNSPHDLATLDGPVRLPALGSVEGYYRFDPAYLAQMKAVGFFEIEEADEPPPKTVIVTVGESGGSGGGFTSMSEDDLRAYITDKTGKAPHHRTGPAKLIEMAREAG